MRSVLLLVLGLLLVTPASTLSLRLRPKHGGNGVVGLAQRENHGGMATGPFEDLEEKTEDVTEAPAGEKTADATKAPGEKTADKASDAGATAGATDAPEAAADPEAGAAKTADASEAPTTKGKKVGAWKKETSAADTPAAKSDAEPTATDAPAAAGTDAPAPAAAGTDAPAAAAPVAEAAASRALDKESTDVSPSAKSGNGENGEPLNPGAASHDVQTKALTYQAWFIEGLGFVLTGMIAAFCLRLCLGGRPASAKDFEQRSPDLGDEDHIGTQPYSSGEMDCCSGTVRTCCLGWFFPCVLHGFNVEKLGGNYYAGTLLWLLSAAWLPCCFLATNDNSKLMSKKHDKVPSSWGCMICCNPCVTCQHARELDRIAGEDADADAEDLADDEDDPDPVAAAAVVAVEAAAAADTDDEE